jgi:hypothetical protein
MAATIPHKFNIVRLQRPELIHDIEKFLPISIDLSSPDVNILLVILIVNHIKDIDRGKYINVTVLKFLSIPLKVNNPSIGRKPLTCYK